MATAKTTIELNGKLYDARTGKIIGEGSSIAPLAPIKHQGGNILDGVSRPQKTTHSAINLTAVPKPKPLVSRGAPKHSTTKLQKSSTLMRPAVKKPKAITGTATVVSHQNSVVKKEDPARQARAANVPRSGQIQRFNHQDGQQHTIIKKQAPLTVAVPTGHNHNIVEKAAHLAAPAEAQVVHSVEVIEESLRNASAHLQTFESHIASASFWQRVGFKNKIANLATLSFAGFLLIGFFAYQNAPNIEMRIAAARSGVSASLPGYSPAGFSAMHGIDSDPGKVTVTFKSTTNDKQFRITQQASNWSSDSLLSNHVLASNAPYQTYQDEGKTVYIYDNSNATWVNGGVWYQVDGNASLTSDQLLRIANSL